MWEYKSAQVYRYILLKYIYQKHFENLQMQYHFQYTVFDYFKRTDRSRFDLPEGGIIG